MAAGFGSKRLQVFSPILPRQHGLWTSTAVIVIAASFSQVGYCQQPADRKTHDSQQQVSSVEAEFPATVVDANTKRLQCWICSDYQTEAVDLLTAGYNRRNVPRCPEYDPMDPNGNVRGYGNLIEAHNSGAYRCVVFHDNDAGGRVVIRGMAQTTTLDSEFGLASADGCDKNMIFPKINASKTFFVCNCQESRCNSNSAKSSTSVDSARFASVIFWSSLLLFSACVLTN